MKSAWILVSVSLSCPTLWGQVPVRVSVDSTAAQADAPSLRGRIAANGRFVVFESDATNLVAGDTNALTDVFFHDRLLGTTELVCDSTQDVPAIISAQDTAHRNQAGGCAGGWARCFLNVLRSESDSRH